MTPAQSTAFHAYQNQIVALATQVGQPAFATDKYLGVGGDNPFADSFDLAEGGIVGYNRSKSSMPYIFTQQYIGAQVAKSKTKATAAGVWTPALESGFNHLVDLAAPLLTAFGYPSAQLPL